MPDSLMIRNMIDSAFTLAQGVTVVDKLRDAWSHTRNLRENGGCSDDNLAIAEHYLYARFYVAEGGHSGWAKMQALITGYNVLKWSSGDTFLPKTGVCKVTSYSALDVDWSFRGADDGLDDYLLGSKVCYDLKAPEPPN
jgi:hypothetical protein